MSKLYLIGIIFIFSISNSFGQTTVNDTIKPQFISADSTLEKYIASNTHYPENAKMNCLRGKVTIGFRISSLGNLEAVTIIKNSFRDLDREAIRVILSTSGKWKPATVNGTPVDFYMTAPFNFWFEDYKCDDLVSKNQAMYTLGEVMEKAKLLCESGTQKLNDKQYEAALIDFNESIRINRSDKDALYNRGVCKLNLGDKAGACEDWKKSKKLSDAKEREEINQLLEKNCKE